MRPITIRAIVILLAMIVASGMAGAMRPTKRLADVGPKVDLEKMIPTQFGEWKLDPSVTPIAVSPDVQARLDVIYNQTLSRTYVNAAGQRIMLSIAYGTDQSGEGTQVHRPEFCYVSQGFQVSRGVDGTLPTPSGSIPVRRLVAISGNRSEPITYWVTVGEQAALPGITRKLAQLKYGLTGKVPDGLLFRVSSINADSNEAYRLQGSFAQSLLASVPQSSRIKLVGTLHE
jgi:EpsI family protein